jgi:hypothetical protein
VFRSDTDSVSVYGQARHFTHWMLPNTDSIHT